MSGVGTDVDTLLPACLEWLWADEVAVAVVADGGAMVRRRTHGAAAPTVRFVFGQTHARAATHRLALDAGATLHAQVGGRVAAISGKALALRRAFLAFHTGRKAARARQDQKRSGQQQSRKAQKRSRCSHP